MTRCTIESWDHARPRAACGAHDSVPTAGRNSIAVEYELGLAPLLDGSRRQSAQRVVRPLLGPLSAWSHRS